MDYLDAAKIKFSIHQEIDLDIQTIKENIIESLIGSGYKIIRASDLKIKFNNSGDNDWSPREIRFKMMEEGYFDILTTENGTIVQLTYYIDAFYEALLSPFILWGSIFGVIPIIIAGAAIFIQLLIQIRKTKNIANDILWDVI